MIGGEEAVFTPPPGEGVTCVIFCKCVWLEWVLDISVNFCIIIHLTELTSNPFLEQFDWDKASAAASLYGSINFALSVGMSNEDITKLYGDFVYDENLINGTNSFEKHRINKET